MAGRETRRPCGGCARDGSADADPSPLCPPGHGRQGFRTSRFVHPAAQSMPLAVTLSPSPAARFLRLTAL